MAEPCLPLAPLSMNQTSPLPYQQFYELSRLITGLIFYPTICLVGLFGNSLALVVLSHKKMATSTNTFLSALAIADVIKLVNDLLYAIDVLLLKVNPVAGQKLYAILYPISHYIFNQSTCVAAWLTVSVAVERYLAICRATKRSKATCFISRARIISVVVFVVMSLAALPSGLRYTRVIKWDECTNTTLYDVVLSDLGRNDTFMIPYSWAQNLLRSIVPLLALFVLNSCIIRALHNRRRLTRKKKWKAKNRITLMLIIVIVVFIICILPDAVMSTCFGFGYADERNMLAKGIREFTDMLLALSSAVNFIIYCVCSASFRCIFLEIFCLSKTRLNGGPYSDRQTPVVSL